MSMSVQSRITVTRSLIALIRQEAISAVVTTVLSVMGGPVPKVIVMMETFARKMK